MFSNRNRMALLLSTSALCGILVSPQRAMAQTAPQMQSIQIELNQLQAEVAQMKSQAHTAQPAAAAVNPPSIFQQSASLPPGTFQLGAVTVTLGGFAALEGVYRTRNEAASIDTNFNGNIPLPNSPKLSHS